MLILIFAQYHFYLSILLMMSVIAVSVLFCKITMHGAKVKTKGKIIVVSRLLLLVSVAVFFIPSMVSACAYKLSSPYYQIEETWSNLLAEVFAESSEDGTSITKQEIIGANPEIIDQLKEGQWSKLPPENKLGILQFIANAEAVSLGIPSVPAESGKLGMYTLGEYNHDDKALTIDLQHVNVDSSEACVETISHEVFHAYQCYVIDSVDWDDESSQCAYFEQALEWKNNSNDYHHYGDEYYEQPLEVDARAYSEVASKAYFLEGEQ